MVKFFRKFINRINEIKIKYLFFWKNIFFGVIDKFYVRKLVVKYECVEIDSC